MKEVDVMGFRVYFASEEPQGGGATSYGKPTLLLLLLSFR